MDFICANTDAQALSDISSKTVLQLARELPRLAGANPEVAALRLWKTRTVLLMHWRRYGVCYRGWAVALARVLPRLWQRCERTGHPDRRCRDSPFSFEGKKRQHRR